MDAQIDKRRICKDALHCALSRFFTKKSGHTQAIASCTTGDLVKHIESLFQVGMSWSNSDVWTIGHVKQVSAFNLESLAQQREFFHFKNLVPVWNPSATSSAVKVKWINEHKL